MKNKIFSAPTSENFANALSAWRLLLIAALIGGLIGAAIYQLWTPPYRAMSKVVVDQNLEQALPAAPDKEIFYFLERETQKLEELAWSDAVLEQLVEQVGGVKIADLRSGLLQLSQPGDGGWRFYGVNGSPEKAKQLAKSWANIFTKEVQKAVNSASELISVKKELTGLTDNLSAETELKLTSLEARAITLEEESHGLHPEIQVSLSQKKEITTERTIQLGAYIFAGAMSALFITLLINTIAGGINKIDADED
jgi:capsular polysaccharide biosynthesis protein